MRRLGVLVLLLLLLISLHEAFSFLGAGRPVPEAGAQLLSRSGSRRTRQPSTVVTAEGGKGFGKPQPKKAGQPEQPKSEQAANVAAASTSVEVPQRKFQMLYTCNICQGRNLISVDRVAFTEGIVIARCKHCDSKHLVADNLSKLDFGKGKVTLEDVLALRGEKPKVVDLRNNPDLARYDLQYKADGTVELAPKAGEPPSPPAAAAE